MYFILYIPGFNWASVTPQLSLFSMEPTWTPTKWVKAFAIDVIFFLNLLSWKCDILPFLLHEYEFLTISLKSARRQYPRFGTFGEEVQCLGGPQTWHTKIFLVNTIYELHGQEDLFFWKNWTAGWFSIGTIIMTISVSTDGFSQKKSAAVPYKCDVCLLLKVVVFARRRSNIEP